MKNIRTCVSCRKKFDKENLDLIKITKENNNIFINNDKKHFGRSCYICNNKECLQKVIKNKIVSKIFKQQIADEIYEKLTNIKELYDK